MVEAAQLMEACAELRLSAERAHRLALGLRGEDRIRLECYGKELETEADELERQAAACA